MGLRPKSVSTYSKSLKRGERALQKPVEAITHTDLRWYMRLDGPSPATKEATITAFKGLHRWALLEGFEWANPAVMALRSPRRRRIAGRGLTKEEVRFLMDSCRRPIEARIVFFGAWQGMRVGESAQITAAHWGETLRFTAKGGNSRDPDPSADGAGARLCPW